MLLILEIGLTIWAWKRGWKGWALLPALAAITIGFFIALVSGDSLDSMESLIGATIILDILCVIILIVMVAKPRRKDQPDMVVATAPSVDQPEVNGPVMQQVEAKTVTGLQPVTILAPKNKASLVLPDKREIPLTEDANQIGRTDFDKALSLEDLKYISRQQLKVKSSNGRYFVEDHNSSNGTRVNGIEIRGKGSHEVRNGDRIDVADVASLTFKV